MKKMYWDVSESEGYIGVFAKDAEIVQAGVTFYSMSSRDKMQSINTLRIPLI